MFGGTRLKLYVAPAKLFTILSIRYRCCIDDPTVALVGVHVLLSRSKHQRGHHRYGVTVGSIYEME